MDVPHPIHQRIDLLSKLVGVVFVAIGVDRFRSGDPSSALSYVLLGAIISLSPFYFKVKKR